MKINKKILIDLVDGAKKPERFTVVLNEINDHSRWSIFFWCIIKDNYTGNFYDASYSIGATEDHDERPFDNEDEDENGNIELEEVESYEKVVTFYRKMGCSD